MVNRLKKIVEGLFYYSESEYPYVIHQMGVTSPGMLTSRFLALTGSDMKPEQIDAAAFFQKCIRNASYGSDRQSKLTTKKYKELSSLLLEKEFKTTVWRMGMVQVDIFICIQDKNNELIILHTKAIET